MIVNLTGQPVGVVNSGGHVVSLHPHGQQARLSPRRVKAHREDEGCRVALTGSATVEGLPPQREGVTLLVPIEVALVLGGERWDLCCVDPGSMVTSIGPQHAPCYSRLLAWDTTCPVLLAGEAAPLPRDVGAKEVPLA